MAPWCIIDLDRTLIEGRTVMRLARRFGCEAEVVAALSGAGEPNAGMEESKRVLQVFSGINAAEFNAVCVEQVLRDGAMEAIEHLRQRGFRIIVATASYQAAAQRAARAVGAAATAALEPEVRAGRLTGQLRPLRWLGDCGRPVCKAKVMAGLQGPVVAIGDGANDVCMFEAADLAIAMRPCHEDAAEAADFCVDHWSEIPALVAPLHPRQPA